MNIVYTATAILGMTAILGIYLLSLVLGNKKTPKAAAFVHGLFAIIGLGLLIFYSSSTEVGPLTAIIIFVIAVFAGFILIYRDFTKKKVPKWLAITHGLTAVAGYGFLLRFAFFSTN